ncbi:hypothetical protein MMIC_P0037 [Mariprofundus micogutta]|uniref:C2H2-type domain-containing protein n=1 Tax=Mariprofundus micogutta TaxID=1921010 RepID=A0A1L8CJK7_9PROT|nr:hypothetical protein MMIC_P0037 [Mariprofundus micogutta]
MGKKSFSRIPVEANGIQANFCKNPACSNYGVPASTKKQPRGPGAASRGRDNYTVVGSGRSVPAIHCHHCNEYPPLKSNQGISEELARISSYLSIEEVCCPNPACVNHAVGVSVSPSAYQSFGKTKSGSPRYRCKKCGKSFSIKRATTGQKQPHKNKLIFKLLMNKTPFRRICEVADISEGSLYPKIDFLHRQCLAFASDRERKLLDGMAIRRLYVSVDRQDYMVNWSQRSDKRNTILSSVGSADNETGYVFGMHLNYDPSLNASEIEEVAISAGDYAVAFPFREHARLWLQGDYEDAVRRSANPRLNGSLNGQIEDEYDDAVHREDVESSERITGTRMLPAKGTQVHSEYTLYGHFFFLHKLFGGVEKVRFFLDQDSGMRAACLAAFQPEIAARTCDAFYVRINKDMTVDEKRRTLADSRREFRQAQKANPSLSESEVKLMLIKQRMGNMAEIGKWKDRWLLHPFPNMSEPEKAICYLTDYGDYDTDHQAWLYNKASMHGIDCFFMQVRRRLSLLERPIASASATGRRWFGYSAYNPESIVKLLDIFRVFYNYCLVGSDKKTPAMRIGLAKGSVQLEDIIYHQ